MLKTWGGRSAVQKLLNGGKLSTRHLASMGKIQGTLCISRLINSQKCNSVMTHWAQGCTTCRCRLASFLFLWHASERIYLFCEETYDCYAHNFGSPKIKALGGFPRPA